MRVIKVIDKVTKDNVKATTISGFDKDGNSIDISMDEMDWKDFIIWLNLKAKIKYIGEDTLENRIRLVNLLIKKGRVIYTGKPFEI